MCQREPQRQQPLPASACRPHLPHARRTVRERVGPQHRRARNSPGGLESIRSLQAGQEAPPPPPQARGSGLTWSRQGPGGRATACAPWRQLQRRDNLARSRALAGWARRVHLLQRRRARARRGNARLQGRPSSMLTHPQAGRRARSRRRRHAPASFASPPCRWMRTCRAFSSRERAGALERSCAMRGACAHGDQGGSFKSRRSRSALSPNLHKQSWTRTKQERSCATLLTSLAEKNL